MGYINLGDLGKSKRMKSFQKRFKKFGKVALVTAAVVGAAYVGQSAIAANALRRAKEQRIAREEARRQFKEQQAQSSLQSYYNDMGLSYEG